MRSLDFGCCAFGICAAAISLVGCGASQSQPPIGAPGAMPQTFAVATHADRSGSWMLPEAKGEDLLYVSSDSNDVVVLAYPTGNVVGTLSGFDAPEGLCSDRSGNIFVVDFGAQEIFEYSHGGQTPIQELDDSGNDPNGCAVDPSSGNLAVAGGYHFYGDAAGNIAIFKKAQGSPAVYQTNLFEFSYCTYDNDSNLFAEGNVNGSEGIIAELPRSANELSFISLDKTLNPGGAIQWDGRYLAVGNPSRSGHPFAGPRVIYRVEISGSSGTVISTLRLFGGKGPKRNENDEGTQFWINGSKIVAPLFPGGDIGLWKYPRDGKPLSVIAEKGALWGITVSTAARL